MTETLDPGARRAILEAVDALRDEGIETLKRLVRCPSTLGNEQSALAEMVRVYEDLGLAPRRVPTVPEQLAARAGVSLRTVLRRLSLLEMAGLIVRRDGEVALPSKPPR